MEPSTVTHDLRNAPRQRGLRRAVLPLQQSAGTWTRRLTAAISITAIVVPVATVCWHLFDYFGLEHGGAVWVAMADWAGRGKVMPPLSFDGYYAGTRYMPLPIVVQSWCADLVGSDVAGGRIVSLGGVVALAAALMFAFRRIGLRWTPSLVLIAGVLMTPAINFSIVSVRNDALPAGVQIIAVSILADRRRAERWTAWLQAGLLAGLAVTWKASAIWCLGAVCLHVVLQRHRFAELRRHYLSFFAGATASLAVGGCVSVIATGGRIFSNFGAVLFSSEYSALSVNLWARPFVTSIITGLALAAPVVCYGVLRLVAGSDVPPIWKAATIACAAFTTLIFVDYQGASINHLVDLLALGVLGVAWAVSADPGPANQRHATVAMATAATLILACIIGNWYGTLRTTVRGSTVPAYSLDGIVVGPGPILSENPLVNIAIGQRPVIADPFAFRRMAIKHPEFKADIIRRVQAHEFAAVVLLARAGRENSAWYRDGSWGVDVFDAICGSYHSDAIIGGGKFELYLPGEPAGLPASSPCGPQSLRYD